MSSTVGIDIGAEAIKGIVLSKKKNGPVEVVAAGTMPIGELGHMKDSADKTLAISIKLKELVRGARLRGEEIRVAVPGVIGGKPWNQLFRGKVAGGRIEGEVRISDGENTRMLQWIANRP